MTYDEELSSAIQAWIEEKESRNMSMLARLANVSYSSVRRAVQKECVASQQTCVQIASIVMPKPEYLEFVERYWPNLKKYVAGISNYSPNKDDVLQAFMESEEHFMVMTLASSENGTNHEEVKNIFGERYLPIFEELIQSACLKLGKNQRWKIIDNFSSPSFELARKMLSAFLSHHNKVIDEINGATTSWAAWESVKPETARDITDILAKSCAEVTNKLTDPQNKGNVLVCTGIYSGILKGRDEL